MRTTILLLSLLCLVLSSPARKKNTGHPVKPVVSDVLSSPVSVTAGGYTGGKLDSAWKNRILAQDVDRLVSPFRNRTETSCWQSEFWGKWLTSAVLAYRYHPDPGLKLKLDKAVRGLTATQSADGYIGNYRDDRHLESWDIWGRKYCMLGLLAWYDLTGDEQALTTASGIAGHLIQELSDKKVMIVQKGNHRGMAASSVLEPMCLLYARTGKKQFLDFAEEIVRQWEMPLGPQLISKAETDVARRFPRPESWYGPGQGQKAYEMMSCYEGLLELYRLTGKPEYLETVRKVWRNIRDTEINIAGSGSAKECWFGGNELQALPVFHYQETCVTVTWIKLSLQLLRLTGESQYADAVEQSWYNALLGAMKPGGSDWAKYSPLSGQRLEGSGQCGMGLNCCIASGPRALFLFPLTAVMQTASGIQVNFFTEGSFDLRTPAGQSVQITQETGFPESGKIEIRIGISRPENFTLNLRIPEWSARSNLMVNGVRVDGLIHGENKPVQREWRPGDLVTLETDMRGRIIRTGMLPENLAILRGPVVLARDSRLPGPPPGTFITPFNASGGYLELHPVKEAHPGILMQFTALFKPESYREEGSQPVPITFCDYASAGNTWDEHSLFRVWFPQLIDPAGLPDLPGKE